VNDLARDSNNIGQYTALTDLAMSQAEHGVLLAAENALILVHLPLSNKAVLLSHS
jgi:hypothetical protein